MKWQTSRFQIDLQRPQVMGIVNVTPDSFSDGGQHAHARQAILHCQRLVEEGVDILDIGGESSRPGATRLSDAEEWSRVEAVLREALTLGVPVSIDTCKPVLMQRALDLGVDIINDIQALRAEGALSAVRAHPRAGVCLMHMRGDSGSMQGLVDYADLVGEVASFLAERASVLRAAGIDADRIVLDPGYGFAKTSEQNFQLLARQSELMGLGYPLLIGWSRKRALGDLTSRPVEQRLAGSLAAALAGVARGARVLRVHDVAATVDAIKVWQAVSSRA
ncbi:dihydropteroate synthase [Paucibacter sp. DJ2R-2]|uniref:dihydropteroate synthase n=1 Tax=Paucibacter sp. DJ2R-2 TaxID=2893558 RepID=UPI0021E40291|nr:dihydropteroate synthase [Paucibacter sp. DJ2R-2]MCV2420776.1 dihydropteroate synthase [Paucibacter sp. DJ4R-1]MCV2439975.1 dihydropteroate synthase [Paucibacter sp. DJ2R-2]